MDNEASDLAQLDEDILTFDVQGRARTRSGSRSGSSRNNWILHSLVSLQLATLSLRQQLWRRQRFSAIRVTERGESRPIAKLPELLRNPN